MTEALYAVIIVVFASLGVLALFNHLVRGNELREAVAELQDAQSQLDGRVAEVKTELEDLKFESDTMDDERVALEKTDPLHAGSGGEIQDGPGRLP